MKNLAKIVVVGAVLVSGYAYAAKMVCEWCNINGETGEIVCYNCKIG